MGDYNQYMWIKTYRAMAKAPVLEIGSKHYSKDVSINYRELFPSIEYIGTDMSEGPNVDIVIDFTTDIETIRQRLGNRKINTVVCCSVLEHVNHVFKMAENISAILEPGGVLFISVPFTWRFHGYPNDYWRFTPEGIKYLFKDFTFEPDKGMTSSNVLNDTVAGTDAPNDFVQRIVPKAFRFPVRILKKLGLFKNAFENYSYVLLPSMINMVGIRK
jgi:hypothetical protein